MNQERKQRKLALTQLKKRDRWDKYSILIQPLVIALVGFGISLSLERSKTKDMRDQLYIELMNNREQSESTLRKDMFNYLMDSYITVEKDSVESKLLNLEMLAYNFHESLNLGPLFYDLQRQINNKVYHSHADSLQMWQNLARLDRAGREIISKQVNALANVGKLHSILIYPNSNIEDSIQSDTSKQDSVEPYLVEPDSFDLELEKTVRSFRFSVVSIDTIKKELMIELNSEIKKFPPDYEIDPYDVDIFPTMKYNINFFDFPMIDNIRFKFDQRGAIVLRRFESDIIELNFLYFKGCYASVKDKAFTQDILNELQSR